MFVFRFLPILCALILNFTSFPQKKSKMKDQSSVLLHFLKRSETPRNAPCGRISFKSAFPINGDSYATVRALSPFVRKIYFFFDYHIALVQNISRINTNINLKVSPARLLTNVGHDINTRCVNISV